MHVYRATYVPEINAKRDDERSGIKLHRRIVAPTFASAATRAEQLLAEQQQLRGWAVVQLQHYGAVSAIVSRKE